MPKAIPRIELKVNGSDLKMEEARMLTFLYYHSIRGSAQFFIHATDRSWSYFDALYGSDVKLQLRFGIQSGNDTSWSPVHEMAVGEAEAWYHPDAVRVTISGMDRGAKIFQTCSQKVWKQKKISDVVSELAEQSGLDTQVEATKDEFDLTQGVIPDGHFIQKVCLPLAYNAARQDYLCYVKEGKTLVFEPPDVGSVQATLVYPGSDADYGPIEPPVVHYRPIFLPPNGSLSTQLRGVDPYKKEGTFFTADDGTVSLKKLATKMPSAPDKPARIDWTIRSKKDMLENVTKALWCNRSRELWIVDAKTVLSPELEVGKAIRLQMTAKSGASHFASGKYILAGMLHWIDTLAGVSISRLWLARRSR